MSKPQIMLNEKEVKELLDRILSIRAGSIFSREFELGATYAFLQVLGHKELAESLVKVYNGNRKRWLTNQRKTKDLHDDLREYFDLPGGLRREKP